MAKKAKVMRVIKGRCGPGSMLAEVKVGRKIRKVCVRKGASPSLFLRIVRLLVQV